MTLNDLRPHIQSRLAHELGIDFLSELSLNIHRNMQKVEEIASGFYSQEFSKQFKPKAEPDFLMDALIESADWTKHKVIAESTKPDGHIFAKMTTPSCHLIALRKSSKNTSDARFFRHAALSNTGLVSNSQLPLLDSLLTDEQTPLDDLLFVCIEIYWDSYLEKPDISFTLPHPRSNTRLMSFSLIELVEYAQKPMTDIAEEPIISLKKRLDRTDNDQDMSG